MIRQEIEKLIQLTDEQLAEKRNATSHAIENSRVHLAII